MFTRYKTFLLCTANVEKLVVGSWVTTWKHIQSSPSNSDVSRDMIIRRQHLSIDTWVKYLAFFTGGIHFWYVPVSWRSAENDQQSNIFYCSLYFCLFLFRFPSSVSFWLGVYLGAVPTSSYCWSSAEGREAPFVPCVCVCVCMWCVWHVCVHCTYVCVCVCVMCMIGACVANTGECDRCVCGVCVGECVHVWMCVWCVSCICITACVHGGKLSLSSNQTPHSIGANMSWLCKDSVDAAIE